MKISKTGLRLLSIPVLGGLLVFSALSQRETEDQQSRYVDTDTKQNLTILAAGCKQDPETLALAIRWLGNHRISAAVPGLIKCLDFRIPDPPPRPQGTVIKAPDRLLEREDEYPAIDALYEIGSPALAPVERIIADNEPDSIVSQNAMEVFQLLFREDLRKGVNFLRVAASESASPTAKERLEKAAADTASKWKRMSAPASVKPETKQD